MLAICTYTTYAGATNLQLHSPSPSLAPRNVLLIKRPSSTDCCRVLREKRKETRGEKKEGRGAGRGLIYLNNLDVMKAARPLLEVGGWSERRKERRGEERKE